MRRIISNALSGKKMRVAATFTGAAALAAAFTPAFATEAKASSIRSGNCAVHPDWLHLRNIDNSLCFGFYGKETFHHVTGVVLSESKYCGGTNYGYIRWSNTNENYKIVTYHMGTTYAKNPAGLDIVGSLFISGWSGTDAC